MTRRVDFTRRVVLTGAESTGKTTLAQGLASHLGAPWVAEFARSYAASRTTPLTVDDVEPIARGQLALERGSRVSPSGLVILDTDLLSTWVYAHHYYGWAPEWIDAELRSAPGALYLLCDLDLWWEADPVRDRAEVREAIQRRLAAELAARRLDHRVVTGEGPARLAAAVREVEEWLAAEGPRRPA